MNNKLNLFVCRCNASVFTKEKVDLLIDKCKQLDVNLIELDDLCAIALNEKVAFQNLTKESALNIIVACYPRAVENLLKQNNIEVQNLKVVNFREATVDSVFNQLKVHYNLAEGKAEFSVVKSKLEVPAWYPVIEKERCTLCGQCARFCLFGVYRFSKKSLEVLNPLSCKNLCPACGRTCPANAIIFPRLKENSVLSGAMPGSEIPTEANQPGTLLQQLNNRNNIRKSIFKTNLIQLAEEERDKALAEQDQIKITKND